MSLLSDAMETCVFLSKQITDDGYGGYATIWIEGAQFVAAIVFDTSIQARVAQAQNVQNVYTVTTSKALNLENRDIFKRITDNKLFRVTSDGDDKHTPESASLDMRQVTAEEIPSLPN